MFPRISLVPMLVGSLLAVGLNAQAPAAKPPDGVILSFVRFADVYGARLVAAFDSIPASRYDYRPTPVQQSIGYIAQHLVDANYAQCERIGGQTPPTTPKDALPDTVKAKWPKDTLVARLDASLRFCDDAMERLSRLDSPAIASQLLALETDLAEHYSQLAVYMRLLGLVPPSALPPKPRTAIALASNQLPPFVGVYELAPGLDLAITLRDGALYAQSSNGGNLVRLFPETPTQFFAKDVDAQITFTRDASGSVTGLIVHQFGRDRPAARKR